MLVQGVGSALKVKRILSSNQPCCANNDQSGDCTSLSTVYLGLPVAAGDFAGAADVDRAQRVCLSCSTTVVVHWR